MITREEALELLKKYNKEDFHIHHGKMVEGTMRYFARELGYGDEEDFWGIVGLLHDIDFEMWPEEMCIRDRLLRIMGKSLLPGATAALLRPSVRQPPASPGSTKSMPRAISAVQMTLR